MATFQKIVLGLLLLLSLFSSQPSSAQGLKYRGTVGISFRDDDIGNFDVVPVKDYLIEIGKDCVYRIVCEPDKFTGKNRLVIREQIPIENMPFASHSMLSSDGSKLFIVGFQDLTTQLTRLWCCDLTSKVVIESTYKGYVRKISNIVDDQICLFFDGGFRTYNIVTKSVSPLVTLKFAPAQVMRGRGVYCSFDGTSTKHVEDGAYYDINQVGHVTFVKRLSQNSNQIKVDADGNITYVGEQALVISRNGDFHPIELLTTSNSSVRVFVSVKDIVVFGWSIMGRTDGWYVIGESKVETYDGSVSPMWFSNIVSTLTYHRTYGLITTDMDMSSSSFSDQGQYQFQLNDKGPSGWGNRRTRVDSESGIWSLHRPEKQEIYQSPIAGKPQLKFVINQNDRYIWDFCITKNQTLVFVGYKGKPCLFEYSQDGILLRTLELDFNAYVCDVEPDGSILIGGNEGRIFERVSRVPPSLDRVETVIKTLGDDNPCCDIFISSSANGDIYVTRSGQQRLRNSIAIYSSNGTLKEQVFDVEPRSTQYWYPQGFHAVSDSGIVYYGSRSDETVKIYFADPNPPKTSASIQSGWYRSNQTVQLSSVEPRPSSGFKALHSVLDTDAEVVDAIPNRTINISGDGQHKLIYWAEDVDGNIETKNELIIGIDSVPPVVDSVVEGNKFILLANDDRSGIASVRYSVDGANDLEYSGDVSLPYGSYEVVFWATDKAGNKSSVGKILVGSTFRWKSVYSSPIYAGKTLKATLELSAPAGSNGVTLDVSASDPSLGSITTATILPGKTATTIEIPVLGVESDRLVDLSASLGGKTASTSVTVLVPYPSFLSINPRDVMCGNNVTITIKLPSVAPIGGQKITLSSSDPRIVVPESITVPSGQTTITLPIATLVSSTSFSATLNARAGEKGSDAVVNVLSLPSSTFKISPATLNPGEKAVGAITLSAPAPASGVQFKLSSSSQDITLPSTVTILPGNVRVLFDITAKSPTTPITATVTATVDKTKLTSKVTIKPSAFKAVKLSSSSFSGEGSIVGTVELTGIAPSSGSLISLASNNANVSLPATVFVPAGSLIANFTVDVKEVKTPGIATITARSGVVVKFASLTLAPITIKTLEAVPSVVTGGSASVLRIELSGKPGPGGITITLSSSKSSVASVPASVSVAQGTTIVEVPIATTSVQTATEVVLSARVGTITKQATITVNP